MIKSYDRPVYGLIFLFKYDPNITSAPTDEASSSDDMADEHIFFAKQASIYST
jgi:hypothetical protein